MKPICVPCHRFYRAEKTGYWFVEAMPSGGTSLPEPGQPEGWRPYKVWQGDLWRCQGCGHQTISGVARLPYAEHYQEDFKETVAKLKADQHTVWDC
jgi:hypothetical protein